MLFSGRIEDRKSLAARSDGTKQNDFILVVAATNELTDVILPSIERCINNAIASAKKRAGQIARCSRAVYWGTV